MHAQFWLEHLKERNRFGDIGADRRIISGGSEVRQDVKMHFREYGD
jgi:hypothetical protein